MQESIQAAETVVKSRARILGISQKFLKSHNVHIHVPEGATPKDGPSAGIGMVTAIVSSMTGIPVKAEVAMTGEITLRGEVLPIGGLKEKTLAAHRGGIKTIIIPCALPSIFVGIVLSIGRSLAETAALIVEKNIKIEDYVDPQILKVLHEPHSSLNEENKELVFKLLAKIMPKDPVHLYWYDKEAFYNLYTSWEPTYQDWVIAEIIKNNKKYGI